MSKSEDIISAGDPVPTIVHVEKTDGPFRLLVSWARGGTRVGEDVIDAAPLIFTFKVYEPLRDDAELFARAKASEDGSAVVWPGNADLEISADALEELADDAMTREKTACR